MRELCSLTSEKVEIVRKFDRLSPLRVEEESLFGEDSKALDKLSKARKYADQSYRDIKNLKSNKKRKQKKMEVDAMKEQIESMAGFEKGDCVIAFSKKDIFTLKKKIEAATGLKCCVVYGSLPPVTRARQAALFNDPKSGYDLLISTDAIGMGLNLNIRRIIFATVTKFDGYVERRLLADEIQQIAGRAGRFSSGHSEGLVNCFYEEDLEYVKDAISSEITPLTKAGLSPTFSQLIKFHKVRHNIVSESLNESRKERSGPRSTLEEIFKNSLEFEDEDGDAADLRGDLAPLLNEFFSVAKNNVSSNFFMCPLDDQIAAAECLDFIKELSLKDKFVFSHAPINTKNDYVVQYLLLYGHALTLDPHSPVLLDVNVKAAISDNMSPLKKMSMLESVHDVIELYIWLSLRYSRFTEHEKAVQQKHICSEMIFQVLHSMTHEEKELAVSRFKNKRDNSDLMESLRDLLEED